MKHSDSEESHLIQNYTRRKGRFASIYESTDAGYQRSGLLIMPADKSFANHWLGDTVPGINERLVVFIRTGGDGSYAASGWTSCA